ncbi:MAG: hypothetical protein E7491_04715 [Ruminococcaceae bacterium]|nr:hypothetical protein [Oscillospiraceae bacterium]
MGFLQKIKKAFIGISVICVVLGAFLVAVPETVNSVICYGFGGLAIVYALIRILAYFINKAEREENRDAFSGALTALLMGLFIIIKPGLVAQIIPFVCGIVIIVNGVSNLQHAIDLKKYSFKLWWTVLVCALISIVCGSLIVFDPFAAANVLTIIIGVSLIFVGLSNIWRYICVLRKIKKAKSADNLVLLDEDK